MAALGDLLQGRRWEQLAPVLGRVWEMLLRALDDIKESVRQAAAVTAKSLKAREQREQ